MNSQTVNTGESGSAVVYTYRGITVNRGDTTVRPHEYNIPYSVVGTAARPNGEDVI